MRHSFRANLANSLAVSQCKNGVIKSTPRKFLSAAAIIFSANRTPWARVPASSTLAISAQTSSGTIHQRPHAGDDRWYISRLNGRGLCASPTQNAEAVKNYPRGIGTIECVEVNAGDIVIQKIVTLFQGEVNTDAADHFRIVFTSL